MIEITASRKKSIAVETPALFAAGIVGFDGSPYRKLIALDKFGALVTAPVTLAPRYPANGTRVVPIPAGFLLHTGLPNPGIRRVIETYEQSWDRSILPIILHLAGETADDIEQMARIADRCQHLAGIEVGLDDQITMRELRDFLHAARQNTDLPVMVRLPLYNALILGEVAQQTGADALVIAAPPRGTERDMKSGRLIGGRVYGAWLKAQVLRMVGRIRQYAEVPVIACGGIHSADDARDFILAGATAVQLDTVVWANPKLAEAIARNLGGTELTRTAGALADEWQPGMGQTQAMQKRGQPTELPEMPSAQDNPTEGARSEPEDWDD